MIDQNVAVHIIQNGMTKKTGNFYCYHYKSSKIYVHKRLHNKLLKFKNSKEKLEKIISDNLDLILY